ncbi:hypothetical protein Tco_1069277 [Tanacetum coccineum]|uniref:Uncharacterized protein n=1 Tax=Tanacetum coccineum TaxID=301880 RepID=A0ABQ5HI10_9ASTR
MNVEVFREILNICPKVLGKEFDEPPTEEEALSFIHELSHSGEIRYITDVIVDRLHQPWRTFSSIINKCLCGKVSGLDKIRLLRVQILWGMYYKKNLDFVALICEDLAYQIDKIDSKKQDKMFYPRFTKIIIHHFLTKDKSISMRNRMFMHTARDDSLMGTMRFISIHADTHVYGSLLPKEMTNQALLDYVAYKTYYVIASRSEPPKLRKNQKKSDSAISYKESPSKKKPAKAKKYIATKPKPSKKKVQVKANTDKGLNVLSKLALSGAAQLKEATKQSKKEFHASHASGLGVLDVTIYESKSEQESWGDSDEEDDDDDGDDDNDDSDNDGNDDNDDGYSDDNDDGDDENNDDDEETDNDRIELDKIKIPVLNQSTAKQEEEEDDDYERVHTPPEFVPTYDEEKMDEDEDDEVTKELYKDVNQDEEDAYVTLTAVHDIQKTSGPMQSSFVSSDFPSKLLNFDNTPPRLEEISSRTSSLFTVPIIAFPEITSATTIPPPPSSFNPLPQQTTSTLTPTTSEATTSFPALPDFSSVFKFNDRVTSLEKNLSKMKQVDQYAQALSFIPAIIDRYIGNQLQEAIQKSIQSHNAECREEALANKKEYIDLVESSVRAIIKEEVNTQLPQLIS